jgi:ribonuclease HI
MADVLLPTNTWNSPFRRFFHRQDPAQLAQRITTGVTLLVITDGGKADSIGTFGWVVAIADEVYAEGYGTVWGNPTQSHRCEAFGNIAALYWLHRLCHHYNITNTTSRVVLGQDNKSLLDNKLHALTGRLDPFTPDYDCITTITELQHQLPMTISHIHVAGHQDTRGKCGRKLTHAEQHNVRADALADKAITDPITNNDHYTPTPFPSSCIHLQDDAGPITSKEIYTLRDRLAEKDYIEYLQQNKGWTPGQIDSVDWYSRNSVIENLPQHLHKFIGKFAHGWLPTNHHLHKLDPRHSPRCPNCQDAENNEHILSCTHNKLWKQEILLSTNAILRKLNTAADLRISLMYSLGQWTTSNQVDQDDPRFRYGKGHPPNGWHLIFCGWIPTYWTQIQEETTSQRPYFPEKGGTKWGRTVIQHFIQCAKDAWDQRNKTIYKPSEDTESYALQHIKDKIRTLHNDRTRLPTQDQVMFDVNIEDLLNTHNIKQLQQWYDTSSTYFKSSLKRAQDQAKLKTRDIRSYFQPKPPS